MILPDKFLDQDTPDKMYKTAGLDCDSIVQKIEECFKFKRRYCRKSKNLS